MTPTRSLLSTPPLHHPFNRLNPRESKPRKPARQWNRPPRPAERSDPPLPPTDEDLEKSETAKNTMATWEEYKQYITEVCQAVEKEAGSISQDQRFYADYLCGVKEFKPWMETAESHVKEALPKPANLAECMSLLEDCQVSRRGGGGWGTECEVERVNPCFTCASAQIR